jgi:hypothetical protein
MKRIGIIGSRARDTEHDFLCCVDQFLRIYEEGDIIVSGGCKTGGDNFAEVIAEAYCEKKPIIYHANWNIYGKGAGFIRNTDIANESDILIAMVTKDKSRCKGTMDTVKKMGTKDVILDDNEAKFNPADI